MADLIDRQALFKQIEIDSEGIEGSYGDTWKFIDTIKQLPSAEPEKRTNKRTETHACDCISRQQAIDAVAIWLYHVFGIKESDGTATIFKQLRELPSAEPQIIRCKECKHRGTRNCVASVWSMLFKSEVADDFYCGIVERMEVDNEHCSN